MSVVARTANSNGEKPSPAAAPPADDAAGAAAAAATGSAAAASPQAPQQAAGAKVTPITEKVRREAAALRNALAFTQIVGVLMRSPHYKQYTLDDLEWLVIPPLLAGQFRIGEATPKEGLTLPVAVVLWARVTAEVDKRLMEADTLAFRLKPEEWTSGDILWLVHAAGETRFVRHVVDQLMKTTFKGREVKVLGRTQDGKPKVHILKAEESGLETSAPPAGGSQPSVGPPQS
jgi:hemolysin-activating ACP:hemolysin acyltransferase